jgi:hypothetical protein
MTSLDNRANSAKWSVPLVPAVVLAGVLLALTGCSQQEKAPEVASIQAPATAGAGQSQASRPDSGSNPDRPRLRLDMSEEEQGRFWDAYDSCLVKEDPNVTNPEGATGAAGQKVFREKASAEASKKCESKMPLPPWEMDDNNPEFKDNWHRNVQCLNGKGLKVTETEPGSWTYAEQPSMPEAEQRKVEQDCMREVFGGGR